RRDVEHRGIGRIDLDIVDATAGGGRSDVAEVQGIKWAAIALSLRTDLGKRGERRDHQCGDDGKSPGAAHTRNLVGRIGRKAYHVSPCAHSSPPPRPSLRP